MPLVRSHACTGSFQALGTLLQTLACAECAIDRSYATTAQKRKLVEDATCVTLACSLLEDLSQCGRGVEAVARCVIRRGALAATRHRARHSRRSRRRRRRRAVGALARQLARDGARARRRSRQETTAARPAKARPPPKMTPAAIVGDACQRRLARGWAAGTPRRRLRAAARHVDRRRAIKRRPSAAQMRGAGRALRRDHARPRLCGLRASERGCGALDGHRRPRAARRTRHRLPRR